MEVKMQTSFIPKKPVTAGRIGGSSISLFLLLSIILFITSLALAGFVWLWRTSLVAQVDKDKAALVAEKDNYDEATIEPLLRLNDRIEQTKSLLSQHLAVTPVFVLLQKKIVQNVQLKSFKFSYGGVDNIKIDLAGIAKNYDALSRQSDAFGKDDLSGFISQPVVSDFNLNPDGTVSFNFSALIDSKLVTYGESVANGQNFPSAPEATTTATTTPTL